MSVSWAVKLEFGKTRPDMSCHASEVKASVKDTKIIDLKNENKAIRKLRSSEKSHYSSMTLAIW